jgi:CheY-like chemotaxis protein/nitrogen-specific signal transduction histidine kinase
MNLCAQALERARLLESERQARNEAEAASQAKTKFLSSVSHEIRAPLHTMAGFADLIYKSDHTPTEQKNWALRISKNAQHLGEHIGNVLDLSKIEADKIEVCHNIFSLNGFIEDVMALTTLKADEKNIEIMFLKPDMEIVICSEPVYLRQILINLIGNAIKFTPPHGQIVVKIAHKNSTLNIQVKDTGVGISSDDHQRIFEPFVLVDSPVQNEFRGTGLGLAISKRLAIALGGDIKLRESAPNKGSIFEVQIPCESIDCGEHRHLVSQNKQKLNLKGIKALVVDDSSDNLFLIKHILNAEGAYVETANNGLEGVEKARNSNFHIIVMDIQMPILDGNKAISMLRASGYKKPIVALTAEVLASQKEESLQRGFDEYLSKPLDSVQLIQTVKRLAK